MAYLAIRLAAPFAVRGGKNSSEKNTSFDDTRSCIRSMRLTYLVAGKNVIGVLGAEESSPLLLMLQLLPELAIQSLSKDF